MIARMTDPVPHRAEMVVDLEAVRHNVRILKDLVSVDGPVQLMTVVKADGYGHGMVPAARAALAGGADALGVAVLEEALVLRAAGVTAPLLGARTAGQLAPALAVEDQVLPYEIASALDDVSGGPNAARPVPVGVGSA